MKKVILSIAIASFVFAANSAVSASKLTTHSVAVVADWAKSKDGTWVGKDKNVWFKLKGTTLQWSTDGKKFTDVPANKAMWADKDGKWLKIVNKKLVWSADGGKTWSDVPEWKWESPDGTWVKIDPKTWDVWTMKDKM
jgi:hypothetical protein